MTDLSSVRRELRREQRQLNLRRFLRNRQAVFGSLVLLTMLFIAVFAPLLAPADPLAQTVSNRFAKPGTAGYLLGADKLGRDLLSRILYGARVSMTVGLSVGLSSMLLGMTVGLYAAWYRTLDNILMRICDGLSAIPSTLLAIALMAVLGSSTFNVILALSFLGVGVPAPQPSWGNILSEGREVITKAWWMIVYPGLATALAVMGTNIFGDGLRDILDPHTN